MNKWPTFGEMLREEMEDKGFNPSTLAWKMGFDTRYVQALLNDTSKAGIGEYEAEKLYFALGVPAKYWLNLQAGCRYRASFWGRVRMFFGWNGLG